MKILSRIYLPCDLWLTDKTDIGNKKFWGVKILIVIFYLGGLSP